MAREDKSVDGEIAALKASHAALEAKLAERDATIARLTTPPVRCRQECGWNFCAA